MTFFGAMPIWGMAQDHPEVDPEQARELAESGQVVLVDAGEPHDWVRGHLPDAVLVGLRTRDDFERIPKDRPVVVGCRDLELGAKIVAELRDDGYDAALLSGGIEAWARAGLPLASAESTTH